MRNTDSDASIQNIYSCFPFAKWHLDRLISVKPSQLYGTFTDPSLPLSTGPTAFSLSSTVGGVTTDYTSVNHAAFNTNELRIAQSLEKIGCLAMFAPKTFRAQQAALFGASLQHLSQLPC